MSPSPETQHPDLERDIQRLKQFAKPLEEVSVTQSIWPVVERVMGLPDTLKEIEDPAEVHRIRENVRECQRLLDEISYEYINQIIAKPEASNVFKILSNSNAFARVMRDAIGEEVEVGEAGADGKREKVRITPELVRALTKYRFSIGTPPLTPQGIDTIEQIMFGGELKDVYAFRDLIGVDRVTFDRFLRVTDTMVEASTHYTTADEILEFELEATDFNNLEGARGLKKAIVSGSADTAEQLIKEEVFRYHDTENGGSPVEVVHEIDDALIERMAAEPRKVFVARVEKIPYHLFSAQTLKEKWYGVIGRLVIIEDSPKSRKTATTLVYSINPKVTEAISGYHVKALGRPANTQMNLRRMIEYFNEDHLENMMHAVEKKIEEIERRGTHAVPATQARTQEWVSDEQRDYATLLKFRQFLEIIEAIKSSDDPVLTPLNSGLTESVEGKAMKYFGSELPSDQYDCVCVPQGGGRALLRHIGKHELERIDQRVTAFRRMKLPGLRERLERLKTESMGVEGHTTTVASAIDRVMLLRRSPEQAIRSSKNAEAALQDGGKFGRLGRFAQHSAAELGGPLVQSIAHNVALKTELGLDQLIGRIDAWANKNLPGEIKTRVRTALKARDLESAAKLLERNGARKWGNRLRRIQGTLRRRSVGAIETIQSSARAIRQNHEITSLDLAERLLNEIEEGTFEPSLALGEVGWSFDDVLVEEDFPKRNYIRIGVDESGGLNPKDLEQKLRSIEEKLRDFPELFEIYCASILLIINDPNNPTGKVLSNDAKLELLDLASKYKLHIISDEAYHKLIASEVKSDQGDPTLIAFYERNRSRFPNPITIHSAIPGTKWAMGAGRRTGVIISSDTGEQGMRAHVRDNTTGVNTLSLYMDENTFTTGLAVKKACKQLERSFIEDQDPITIIDELLEDGICRFDSPDFSPPVRFALMRARNDFDRLTIRGEGPDSAVGQVTRRQYLSEFIKKLKQLRLDKQTRKDTLRRSKEVKAAIAELEEEFPGLSQRCTATEGPFYFCVRLDESGTDPALKAFTQSIAKARNIDAVPIGKGSVRFAFGGLVDGTDGGYALLRTAIMIDLKLILQYWDRFQEEQHRLEAAADLNPVVGALKTLFPGGEADIAKTIEEKSYLITCMRAHREARRRQLVMPFRADLMDQVHRIEPDAPTDVVTSRNLEYQTIEEFLYAPTWQNLFNHYLVQQRGQIPGLEIMDDQTAIAEYGALQFAERFRRRIFRDRDKEIFGAIAMEIAKCMFSDDTIKVLAVEFTEGIPEEIRGYAIMGMEVRLREFFMQFLRTFISEEQEASLKVSPMFQAGYEARKNLKADSECPQWLQTLVPKTEFAGKSMPTDPSPGMTTNAATRVAGGDRGIYRRDGDGENAPTPDFFRDRLQSFAETMDPKDYVAKMVQVGPVQVMLVMHRSYTHYIAEELRLMPQYDIPLTELGDVKPDAVSFLGLPTKVMGETYRIGYFMDDHPDGGPMPVSWVDRERITDYMGYLKKPLLTAANERVKAIGGLPIHGSAVTLTFKNGLRKTAVLKGDSGVGKSETLIAMIEKMIAEEGSLADIESIDLLAGDMLYEWIGRHTDPETGNVETDLYITGTEQGDFMRMTDIGPEWRNRFRDLLAQASRTNRTHPTNPRYTVQGLCDPKTYLGLVRVNMAGEVNNFENPDGPAFQEHPSPETFMTVNYPKGYRSEKGTSGDYPNLFGSLSYSSHPEKDRLLAHYGEDLDMLLGWKLILDERIKPKNGILSFNDIPGGIFKANQMIKDIFVGQRIQETQKWTVSEDGEGTEWIISDTSYRSRDNEFWVTLSQAGGATLEVPIDRNVFDQVIDTPIASTFCGNPFMDPRDSEPMLRRFGRQMHESGIIAFTIYSRLAVPGQQFAGPAQASVDAVEFIERNPHINDRFQRNRATVEASIREKYGATILGQGGIPDRIQARNLFLLERYQSDRIQIINAEGEVIPIQTPEYRYNPKAAETPFTPTLITPDIKVAIRSICENPAYDINLDDFDPDMEAYESILGWDSPQELTYQVLLVNGIVHLGDETPSITRFPKEVRKAERIAERIIERRGTPPSAKAVA